MLHINNIYPRLVKMPPKIPPAWPQDVQRHLALHDRIHGTSHLSDYLAGTDVNPVMDVRIGQLLDMRNAASERRQGVIASAAEARASSVEAPASAVHMEAAGSSSGGGDPMVDFMPPLPSSTFKRLFKTCKSKAKPQAIDLSDDEVLPSASASSGQGGEASMDTGGEAAEASMDTGGEAAEETAEETEAAEETWGSTWSEDDLQSWRDLQHASEASNKVRNKGQKRTLRLWQRMQSLKRQGLWVGDEPDPRMKQLRLEREGQN